MDDDLVASGRYARLDIEAVDGGRQRTVTVGFLPADDGSIVVAATAAGAGWARALSAAPAVRVSIGERSFAARATEVDDADPARAVAVRDLILRYGTPSEGLGHGPVFRLCPVAEDRART
jgi:deazaflavin-dependent oxidoreductase (nitroreductase family)